MDNVTAKELMAKAASWMIGRGWKLKLAKKGTYEQSLFEHSMTVLDVLLGLIPIIAHPKHYSLSEEEQIILAVSVLAHDIGKETDTWQIYIQNPTSGPWASHIIPDLTRDTIPRICAALNHDGISDSVQKIMSHCIEFHHSRPGRSDGAILEAMLSGGSDRFLSLAHLVRSVDHFCSAANASEAVNAMQIDPALGHHLQVTSHEVVMRGVSTTFLHRSAQRAFQERGWKPLLYFSNATVYAADPNDAPIEPTWNEIHSFLKEEINTAIARDVTPLMVGSPTGNILPKPELLSFKESRQYLSRAGQKIGTQSFLTTYNRERAKGSLKSGRGKTKAAVIKDYWTLTGNDGEDYSSKMDIDAGRISVAQPEMIIFKFFKAMMDPSKVTTIGPDGAEHAGELYEITFGDGSWVKLQSTSTLMPANDMAKTVDYFWALPGSAVGHPEVATVSELPDQTRLQTLVDLLDKIAQQVYEYIDRPSPRDQLAYSMSSAFVLDLVRPLYDSNIQSFAQNQLDHYSQSKAFAGKENKKGIYLCPICNIPFNYSDGIKASANFIDNPQTHSNRGIAHGPFDYIMICVTCYYERLLIQVLLGSQPKEIITLLPRFNLGHGKGEELIRKVREWIEAAQAQMRGETGNLEVGFSFGLTDQVASRLGSRDPLEVQPEELLPLFSYRFAANTQAERKKEALKRLKEEFDNDLEALNVTCNQLFSTWEIAVETLMEGQITQQELRSIRREVFRLCETVHLICQTPNLIFVPLTYEIAAGDESEASKGIRRLYVSLLLSLVFDASIAIHRPSELVDFHGIGGAAYVPSVSAIRSLIGLDWIPIHEAKRWLSAIGAASLLIRPTGYTTTTGGPTPSALYQILAANPAEMLARRIEETRSTNLTLDHIHMIAQLPGFHAKEIIHESSNYSSN